MNNKPEIVMMAIEEIKPYEKNPRFNDNAVEYVANSIKEFGFKVPIVVDKDNVIVNGHTRYKASQKLGLKQVPVIVANDLTEKQIKAYRIADNKTSDLADWNTELLGEELKLLDDFDLTDFGFNELELMTLTEDIEPEEFDNEMIDEYSKGLMI
jgi:site-specific DNA-methyltransferase (adenine-specific)